VSFSEGVDVPIPIFPDERVLSAPSIPVPKMIFPILSVFDAVVLGTSISYPMTIFPVPLLNESPAFAPRKILFPHAVIVYQALLQKKLLLSPESIPYPACVPKKELFE